MGLITKLFPLTEYTVSNIVRNTDSSFLLREPIAKTEIGRGNCLKEALARLILGPIVAVGANVIFIYKKKILNPLDMVISIVACVILMALKGCQLLLGAIIHPSIAFVKSELPPTPTIEKAKAKAIDIPPVLSAQDKASGIPDDSSTQDPKLTQGPKPTDSVATNVPTDSAESEKRTCTDGHTWGKEFDKTHNRHYWVDYTTHKSFWEESQGWKAGKPLNPLIYPYPYGFLNAPS